MESDWKETTLGEILTLQRGFDLPETERQTGPYPVVASTGPVGSHSQAMVNGPGVVIGRSGSIGGGQYIEHDFWPLNTTLWVKDFKGNDRRFCYYLLKSLDFTPFNVGSGVPTLNRNHIHPLPLRIPADSLEQRAIAHILGTLDDKIELNRRMNETLEAMVQALFKSWFVNFEPVRAKVEGRDIGLPEVIADLFPGSFKDSELGEMPRGWRVTTIGELAEVVGGSTPSTKDPAYWEDGRHCWATPKDLSNLSVPVLLETEKRITDIALSQISSRLLPPGTVLLSSRAPIGYRAIAEVPVAINQGFIAMKTREGVSNLFLWLWAGWAHETILSRANGSTFMEISKRNFRPIPVVTPPPEVFTAFDNMARPIYERIVANERESRTLIAQRDTLLPKLLSGEVRINQESRRPKAIHSSVITTTPIYSERKATDEFIEAIVIAQLVRQLATPKYPLGRKRYNKFAYLAHRRAEEDVAQQYLKKAAGPYSPWAKYQGPEGIAQRNGYVKTMKLGDFEGMVVGDRISDIDRYLPTYPITPALNWVINNFRYRKNDDLELLATVDFAALDLLQQGKAIALNTVKQLIATNKEWAPKLNRDVFSDENILQALVELRELFPATYQV